MNTLQIKALRLLVQTIGTLSDGIRIAQTDGFTSGKMLDYVYRNKPSGRLGLGKLLDYVYLSHKGWEAVRVRRSNLEELLEWSVRRQLYTFGRAFVLDVAAGYGRYLLEILARLGQSRIEAVCWDKEERWLSGGRKIASAIGVGNVLYMPGDALDGRCYERLPWLPHVVVASGFYDWMEDDDCIKRSMRLVHRSLCRGGHFLFTAQTGHADLHMVNQIFTGFDGEALSMKVRPASTMLGWAEQQGFVIQRVRSDDQDYHMVVAAQKR